MPNYMNNNKSPSVIDEIPGFQDDSVVEPSVLTPEQQEDNSRRESLFNFTQAKTRLKQLISDWSPEIDESQKRRLKRNIDISPKQLRESGILKADETLIPIRVINTNIEREKPPFISFLKQSRRLAIFKCKDRKGVNTEELESEFTEGMSYSGWEIPHFKNLDGAQVHGWDSVEVVFDTSKPLHTSIEHVGHDKLLFPRGATNLQSCEMVIRVYTLTQVQLREYVKDFGFNKEQVTALVSERDTEVRRDEVITVYKVMFKFDGVVNVAWFDISKCSDWLKAPSKLYLGIREFTSVVKPVATFDALGNEIISEEISQEWVDSDESVYPFFILPYNETEEDKIFSHKGRVFLDEHKQEAQTAIASGFVNGLTRAANVYGSVRQDSFNSTAAPKQLDCQLEHGAIYDKPIDFWGTNYPEPSVLSALQFFDVQNSNETGQLNFAVQNRKDSRKTATEIASAEQQSGLLTGVSVTLFSTHIREVYTYVWRIVQSQALQDKIKFLLVSSPPNALGQVEWINNSELLSLTYTVKAAGDIDVVQRAEKLQRMQQFWPTVSQTPIANKFLQNMLRVAFPEDGELFAQDLAKADQFTNLMQSLQGLMQQLPPEAQALIGQLMQQQTAPQQ